MATNCRKCSLSVDGSKEMHKFKETCKHLALNSKRVSYHAHECDTSHLKSLFPPSLAEPVPVIPRPTLIPVSPVPPPSPFLLYLLSASRK